MSWNENLFIATTNPLYKYIDAKRYLLRWYSAITEYIYFKLSACQISMNITREFKLIFGWVKTVYET